MKYYRNFFSQLKIYVATPMSCIFKFTSYMTIISNFFIVMINEFFTNPASVAWLILVFFFFSYDQVFVKLFFHYFFTEFILSQNCFNKFISSVLTLKNNNWHTKSIINANNFVSKTTRNMIMVFFLSKNLHKFQLPPNYTQSHNKI